MARMPGTTWKPIAHNYTKRKTAKRRVILHVAESESTSIHGWFNNPTARASSHFYVARDGKIEQYVDTDYIAWTSGEGNTDSIGVETQGRSAGPWTPEQCAALARIIAWAHKTHGVPLRLMASSKPTEQGVGWHRLGVDGHFPALPSMLAGRGQRGGGEKWSSARGKSCPGDDRIPQIPGILAQAQARPSTGTKTTTGAGKKYKITGASSLNVRTGPGTKYARLGSAPKGTTITGTGKTSNGWIEGATPYMLSHGQTGWWSGAEMTEVK